MPAVVGTDTAVACVLVVIVVTPGFLSHPTGVGFLPGRSPGWRRDDLSLPKVRRTSVVNDRPKPLTVAGAASALGPDWVARTKFPFQPHMLCMFRAPCQSVVTVDRARVKMNHHTH